MFSLPNAFTTNRQRFKAGQRCRDGVMNEFVSWCRHLLVPFLFHAMTSLHPPSFHRNYFSTCEINVYSVPSPNTAAYVCIQTFTVNMTIVFGVGSHCLWSRKPSNSSCQPCTKCNSYCKQWEQVALDSHCLLTLSPWGTCAEKHVCHE